MLLSHHQNAEQNHDIKIVNRSFEEVAQFKYLETTVKVKLSQLQAVEAYRVVRC
jgi:hypothetical protein